MKHRAGGCKGEAGGNKDCPKELLTPCLAPTPREWGFRGDQGEAWREIDGSRKSGRRALLIPSTPPRLVLSLAAHTILYLLASPPEDRVLLRTCRGNSSRQH